MGEANRRKASEASVKAARHIRILKMKRLPKALFWACTYPLWLWLLFFLLVIKTGKSPLKEALDP